MLTIAIGFILGAMLGLLGLRLLAYWSDRPLNMPHFHWPHRRH